MPETTETPTLSKWGVSKKASVAIAAMTTVSTSQSSLHAIAAITLIGCLAITIQGFIDWKKGRTHA